MQVIPLRLISLAHRIGRRGAFLLFLAMLDIIYAYSLIAPTATSLKSPTYLYLMTIGPLWPWALLWGSVGLICLFYAFRRNDAIGYGSAVFLKALWAFIFLLGWLLGLVERGYLSAVIWGTFGLLLLLISTWPEPEYVP